MRRALRILGIVVVALAVVLGGMTLWGSSLPRDHVASKTAHLAAPPEEVFALITDIEGSPSWREGLDRVELLGEVDGHLRWVEHSDFGPMTMERIEADPPRRVVGRIVDTGEGFGGTWTFDLAPRDGGTDLTITERGFIDSGLFRFLGAYVFGHTSSLETYLASAQQAVESP